MSGRVALVTGSGGGIGKAVARRFAEEGACVVLSDIDGERLESALEDFRRSFGGDRVAALRMDVSDRMSVEELELGFREVLGEVFGERETNRRELIRRKILERNRELRRREVS